MTQKNLAATFVYIGTSLMVAGTWVTTDWKSMAARVTVQAMIWWHVFRCITRDSGSHRNGEDSVAG